MRLTYAAYRAPLLAGLALLSACSGKATTTPEQQQEWEIVPDLSIGGADSGPTSFSDIRGLTVDDAGRIAVLDFAMQQIQLFDSTGAHLKTIGRKGQGPGEFANANGLQRAPDGTLWVNDPNNNRLSLFTADGDFLRGIFLLRWGFGYIWAAGFEPDGTLLEAIPDRVDTVESTKLRRFSADGAKVDTLATRLCDAIIPEPTDKPWWVFKSNRGQSSYGIPFMPYGIQRFDHQGHIWCGNTGVYAFTRAALFTTDTLRLTGSRTASPVTPADRDSEIVKVRGFMKQIGFTADPDFSRIPTVKPIIKAVFTDDAGRLWVQPYTADSGAVYDIFGESGRLVAIARSPLAFNRYQPVVFKGDRVWFIASDADGVPKVVRGRIKRGGQRRT